MKKPLFIIGTVVVGIVAFPVLAAASPDQAAPAQACTDTAFCDDFESQTGNTPTGDWEASYPDCQGTGTVNVDHSIANSGSTSVRVDGGSTYCNHAFAHLTANVDVGDVMFARFYVRHTTPLPAGHVAFGTLTDANDDGKHLRIGGQNEVLQWNRESDDATLPAQSPAGVAKSIPLPVDQWSCVEFRIDSVQGTMSTWVDGLEVAGLHLDQTPTPDIDEQWLNQPNWRPDPANLSLGWESYAEDADTFWFDDVAIDSARIGC